MCIEISNNNLNMQLSAAAAAKKPPTYSIKKLIKQLFKARISSKDLVVVSQNAENSKKVIVESLESLESLDNQLNADIESNCSLECYENDRNEERISVSCELEDCDFADLSAVPVHFVRTEHGTFFWTAITDIPADNDLIAPLSCSTANQIAVSASFKDRWAQA